MAHIEITFNGIAHRDVHTVAFTLTMKSPAELDHSKGGSVYVKLDMAIVTFVRTPKQPVWQWESIEVGGRFSLKNGGVYSSRRYSAEYRAGDQVSPVLQKILDEAVENLLA